MTFILPPLNQLFRLIQFKISLTLMMKEDKHKIFRLIVYRALSIVKDDVEEVEE